MYVSCRTAHTLRQRVPEVGPYLYPPTVGNWPVTFSRRSPTPSVDSRRHGPPTGRPWSHRPHKHRWCQTYGRPTYFGDNGRLFWIFGAGCLGRSAAASDRPLVTETQTTVSSYRTPIRQSPQYRNIAEGSKLCRHSADANCQEESLLG